MSEDKRPDRTASQVLRDNAARPVFWLAVVTTAIVAVVVTNSLGVSTIWALPAASIVARLFIR